MEETSSKNIMMDSRISRVLSLRTDSLVMLEALDTISSFYDNKDLDVRNSLKENLEEQNLDEARKFLTELNKLDDYLTDLSAYSSELLQISNNLSSKVTESDKIMKNFINKARELETKKSSFLSQSKEINNFLVRYHIKQDEINKLKSANLDNSVEFKQFLDILTHLNNAYEDCKTITNKQFNSLSFELLESLGSYQELAYLHLFQWIQKKCHGLSELEIENDEEINLKLQIMIKILKNSPIFYQQCQELIINAHKKQLVHKFLFFLSSSSSSSATSPSSSRSNNLKSLQLLNNNDPIQYLGSILAWIHQMIVVERDFYSSLFPSSLLSSLLAETFQDLIQPLQSAFTYAFELKISFSVVFSIIDTLAFYYETFYKLFESIEMESKNKNNKEENIDENMEENNKEENKEDIKEENEEDIEKNLIKLNPLLNLLYNNLNSCKKNFNNLLLSHSNNLNSILHPLPVLSDLRPSQIVKEITLELSLILKSISSALSSEKYRLKFEDIVGDLLQPVLKYMRICGQSLAEPELAIYMLNNLSHIRSELQDIPSSASITNSWNSLLSVEINTWTSVIIRLKANEIFNQLNVSNVIDLLEIIPSDLPASQQPGLEGEVVAEALRSLSSYIFSAMFGVELEKLIDPEMREEVTQGVIKNLSHGYLLIANAIKKPSNGYNLSVKTHTEDEINIVLGKK